MSSTPQTEQVPAPTRRNTVIMGHQDFVSVLFRAINAELYKFRRRMMSKMLILVGMLFIIGGFLVISFAVSVGTTATAGKPDADFLPPPCTLVRASAQPQDACLDHAPTQIDLSRAEQAKQEALQSATGPLHLPGSLLTAVGMTNFIGLFLLVTLAGTIVGGEYSVGTIRLMLIRGPTRTQFLLAKVGAILACTLIAVLILVPTGIVVGAILLFIHMPSIVVNFSFFTGSWLLHAVLSLLAVALGLFVYAMIALCLSTLGKATVAGVAGAIFWWIIEGTLSNGLVLLSSATQGPVSDFWRSIPNYFIGNNIAALLTNQSSYLQGGPRSTITDLHALLVLAAYLLVFIGLAWWVNNRRDITN